MTGEGVQPGTYPCKDVPTGLRPPEPILLTNRAHAQENASPLRAIFKFGGSLGETIPQCSFPKIQYDA